MSQTKAQLVAGTSDQTVAANTVTTTNIKNPSSVSNNIVLSSDGTIGGACLTQTCRAWVNFNGTGTVAIRASYNVSSITDNGVGDYTVNFTTALPDANYSIGGSSGGSPGTSNGAVYQADNVTAKTTTAFRIYLITVSGALIDAPQSSVQVFR